MAGNQHPPPPYFYAEGEPLNQHYQQQPQQASNQGPSAPPPPYPYPQSPPAGTYPMQYGNKFEQGVPANSSNQYPVSCYPYQTTVVVQPTGNVHNLLGRTTSTVTCPHCQARVSTAVRYKVGSGSWIACLALFGIGFVLTVLIGCGIVLCCVCWVPFCVNDCKDVVHSCPNCDKVIGEKRPTYF